MKNKNKKLVNNINNRLIDLRNDINKKEITENKSGKVSWHCWKLPRL